MGIPSFTFGEVLDHKRSKATIKLKTSRKVYSDRVTNDDRRVWAIEAIHRGSYFTMWIGHTTNSEGTMLMRLSKRPVLLTNREAKDTRSLLELALGETYSFDLVHVSAI